MDRHGETHLFNPYLKGGKPMKKVVLTIFLIFVLLAGTAAAADPIELKFAIMGPAQQAPVVKCFRPWGDKLEAASEGAVKFNVYAGGTLGRDPRVQYKIVADGVADMAFVVPLYTTGRFPDDEIFAIPLTAKKGMEFSKASHGLFKKGLLSGYDDVVVLAHFATEVNYIHSTYPVRVPADLKGHKFRTSNNFHASFFKSVGATGVGMPSPKVAENMSRGIIHGTIHDNSAIFTFGIAKVAKYHLLVPMGGNALAVIMNKKKYQSLPDVARKAIDELGEELVECWVKAIQWDIEKGMKNLKKDPAHKIVTPTAAEMKLWEDALYPQIDQWVAKVPKRASLLKAYKAELERIRAGN